MTPLVLKQRKEIKQPWPGPAGLHIIYPLWFWCIARSPFNRVKICWSDGRWDSSQWLWFDAIYCDSSLHVGFETLPLLLFSSHVFKPVFLRCWLHLANSTGHPKWISMDKLYFASIDQHRNKQIVFADIVPVICNLDEHTVGPGSQTAKSKLVGCNDIEYRHAHILYQ